MIMKNCTKCGRIIPYGKPRCPECESTREAEITQNQKLQQQRSNAKKDKKLKKFYGSADWERVRTAYALKVGGKCEKCGKIGQNVHHIQELSTDEGWLRRFDFNNLELLCIKCHNAEHGRF